MDNRSNKNRTDNMEIEISVKHLVKKVIASWKTVVLFSILMAIVLSGAKYILDVQKYKAAINEQKQEETLRDDPEKQIKSILEAFDPEQVETIEFTSNQRIWVNKEKFYLKNSLLMQMDLTNTNTLSLIYRFRCEDNDKLGDLLLTYANFSTSNETIERIKPYIVPQNSEGIRNQFIEELISVDAALSPQTFDVSRTDVLKILISLPEGADSEGLENAFTTALKDYEKKRGSIIGEHTIELIDSSITNEINGQGIDRRNQISNDIYTIVNNIKNNKTDLSPEEQAAIDKIVAIRSAELEDNHSDDDNKNDVLSYHTAIDKPELNKKIMLLGFILGFVLYSFAIVISIILRGKIQTAEETVHLSGAYLLGEINYEEEQKGIRGLHHSKLVSRYLSRNIDETETAVRKTTNTIAAMYEHEEMEELTLLCVTGSDESIIQNLQKSLIESGIKVRCLTVDAKTEEAVYLSIDKAVCVSGDDTMRRDLSDVVEHCQRYGIDLIGNVFIGKVI